jgi:hypothetical protein
VLALPLIIPVETLVGGPVEVVDVLDGVPSGETEDNPLTESVVVPVESVAEVLPDRDERVVTCAEREEKEDVAPGCTAL